MLFLNHQQLLTLHLIQSSLSPRDKTVSLGFIKASSSSCHIGVQQKQTGDHHQLRNTLLHYITLVFSTRRAHTTQYYSRHQFTDLWEIKSGWCNVWLWSMQEEKVINRSWLRSLNKLTVLKVENLMGRIQRGTRDKDREIRTKQKVENKHHTHTHSMVGN